LKDVNEKRREERACHDAGVDGVPHAYKVFPFNNQVKVNRRPNPI